MNAVTFALWALCLVMSTFAVAQMKPLYTGAIPYNRPNLPEEKVSRYPDGRADGYSKVAVPTLERFDPALGMANRKMAVLVLPGGGNANVSYDREGIKVGKWLASKGYTAFALKYRLPDSTLQTQTHWVPLTDAATALSDIRKMGAFAKVGVMGFSAGGHLAASLCTLTELMPQPPSGARPDFAILVYPVISSGSPTHARTFANLFSKRPSAADQALFSLENQVTAKTPPTFIIHSQDDKVVPVENALLYYKALTKQGVPAEMHLYPKGGHGYNLGEEIEGAKNWPADALEFMERLK